jgi:cell pole-organizing protein PopZ
MKRLALLIVAAAVLAGCGGSSRMSKASYEQKLQTDGKAVQSALTSLSKSPPKTLAQLATRVDTIETVVKKMADDLSALKPPSEAEADNSAIVTGLRRIESGAEQVKSNPTSAATIVAAIQKSPQLKAADKAIADLKSKGYEVGVIGLP